MINTIVAIVLAFNLILIEGIVLYGIWKKSAVKKLNHKTK